MKQGEIVLVPFPFTDLSAKKVRPALVISKKNYDDDLILLGITSRNSSNCITINNVDLRAGLIPLESYVKVRKVATVDKRIVRKSVAKLKREKLKEVMEKFEGQF